MFRIALGLLLALVLSACSYGEGSEPGGANDAETFKNTMDSLAADLLPDLRSALGGAELAGMQAHFYEPGGSFGIWKYTAEGLFTDPPGKPAAVLDAAEGVLTEHGLDVERDDQGRLSGQVDGVLVLLEAVSAGDPDAVRSLTITMVSDDGLTSRDDFAEDAGDEDYTAYVQ